MILTLRELADYLRVNERTILRMQQTGQIQGVKIGGQWRFNGSQIDRLFFPDSTSENPESVSLEDLGTSHLAIPVSRVLSEDRIIMDMEATTSTEAIDELLSVVQKKHLSLDMKDLRERILAREELLSTGVGNGIAIPHPRDPVPTIAEPAIIVFGKSSAGIDFAAVDGKPIHLFFLLCNQNIEMHLHMMGRLAQLLRHEDAVARIDNAGTAQEVVRAVLDVERHDFLREDQND